MKRPSLCLVDFVKAMSRIWNAPGSGHAAFHVMAEEDFKVMFAFFLRFPFFFEVFFLDFWLLSIEA